MAGACGVRHHACDAGAKAAGRPTLAKASPPCWRNANPSTRSPRWRAFPSDRVFDRPAPPAGCRAELAAWESRAISISRAPGGAQGPHFPQSASQAARKKLTRSRTKAGNSLRSSFAPSPIKARIIIGSKIRSMKICAVARRFVSGRRVPWRRAKAREWHRSGHGTRPPLPGPARLHGPGGSRPEIGRLRQSWRA